MTFMILKTIILGSLFIALNIVSSSYNVSLCDSSEIDGSIPHEEEKLNPKEIETKSIISRIWNYPIIQNRIFTLRTSHIISSCFYMGVYVAGIHQGFELVFTQSYSPLLKKLILSPHTAFFIIDEQLKTDKYLRQAINIANSMKNDNQ